MRLSHFLTTAVWAMVLATPALAADNVQRMDEIIQTYVKNNSFMGSVLVARDGKAVLDKGYGYANVEWQIANTPDTRFRLGSVTKQFTAVSILLLQERGKLTLDAPVKTYIADAPPAWDKVTVRHLLNHTSGIPSFTGFADFREKNVLPTTLDQTIARFRDKPLDFQPGEKWNYSNSGYILLGAIIEKAGGVPYARFVEDNIFKPLGMNDSGYDTHEAIIPRRASGYVPSPNGPLNAPYSDMSVPHAAGALYSTTHDLAKWETGLFGGRLLSPASLKAMTTPGLGDYGLGVFINGKPKRVSHSGGIEGFNTQMTYYPDDKLTIVVLGNINGGAPDAIAARLGEIAQGKTVVLPSERPEVSVPVSVLQTYMGSYQVRPGLDIVFTIEKGKLVAEPTGQPKLPLVAVSRTRFMAQITELDFEFFAGADGKVDRMVLYQGGREYPAPRK